MNPQTGFLSRVDWLPLLGELAAKATLVLLLTAVVAALLWRSSAAVRHLVWCVGVACVLALPVFSLVLPDWELPLLPASARTVDAPLGAANPPSAMPASAVPAPALTAPVETAAPERGAWVPRAAAMLAGAGMLVGVLWIALGFWGVSRIGRRAQLVRDPEWLRTAHDAAEGLGLRRPVLLLRAGGAVMPATWGLLWPSIVLPSLADEWPDDRRRAVLAHELAHVKRFDCLTQALAQLACVVFWWHPAVWYAARRLRVERERACDDLVLRAGTRASEYAGHLLEIARSHRGLRMAAPAMVSMARPSHLESRLLWVLDGARPRGVPSAAATLLTVLAGLLVVGPLAAMRPGERAPAAAETTRASGRAQTDPVSAGVQALAKGEKRDGTGDRTLPKGGAVPGRSAAADTIPDARVDELIAMRAVGVDAAYIATLRDAGYSGLTARQLIALAANGISGEDARELNGMGLGRLTPDELISLAALGVTPAYLAELRSHGLSPRTAEEVAGLAALGVDGDYVREMAAAGVHAADPEALSGLRALDVSGEYVRELRAEGLGDLSAEELQGLRALGVTGDYVRRMRAAGVDGLDAESLAGLRSLSVTAEYVREMESVGLDGLGAEELVELKAAGVTAEYVRELRAEGFAARTVDEVVELRAGDRDRVRKGRRI